MSKKKHFPWLAHAQKIVNRKRKFEIGEKVQFTIHKRGRDTSTVGIIRAVIGIDYFLIEEIDGDFYWIRVEHIMPADPDAPEKVVFI